MGKITRYCLSALALSAMIAVLPVGAAQAQVRGSAAVDVSPQPAASDDALDDRLAGGPGDAGRTYRSDEPVYRPDYDDRSYESGGQVRGQDGTQYSYTEEARRYTDDARRYTERYGQEGRGYYERPYDRDYRPRYDDRRYDDRRYGDRRYDNRRYDRRDTNYRYRYDGRGNRSSFDLSVDLGDVVIGYRDGWRDGYYVYYDGRNRYRHRDWRRGYSASYRCHPVNFSEWRYGRRARVVATMCYDRYGYGYIVPGSERVYY